MDSIVGSLPVSFYDPLHHRIHFLYKNSVPGSLIIKIHTVDKQKRRIHRIIKGFVSALREKVWHQPSPFMNCKGSENLLCRFILTGRNTYPRKGDHGISSPVLKKRIACKNGSSVGRFPSGNKLAGAFYQILCHFLMKSCFCFQSFAVSLHFQNDNVCILICIFHRVYQLQNLFLTRLNAFCNHMSGLCKTGLPSSVTGVIAVKIVFPYFFCITQYSVCPEIKCHSIGNNRAFRILKLLLQFRLTALCSKLIKRYNLQFSRFSAAVSDTVAYCHCIFSLLHGNLLADLHSLNKESPYRHIVKYKRGKIRTALLLISVCKLLGRKNNFLFTQTQTFLQTMYHIVSVIGRLYTGHQKSVIVSCHRACHGHGRKSSQTVGKEITVFLPSFQIFQFLFSVNPLHSLTSVPGSARLPAQPLPSV